MSLFDRWRKKKQPLTFGQKPEDSLVAAAPQEENRPSAALLKEKAASKKYHPAVRLLRRLLITERLTHLQNLNQYGFEVLLSANKSEIKKAIEARYGVQVEKVRVMNYSGKKVRYGRMAGKRKQWKKALVTVKAGQQIAAHAHV